MEVAPMLDRGPTPGDHDAVLPPRTDFAASIEPAAFAPVDGRDWLGLADVVASTAAIRAGRYKAVNMAGAAVISGVMNAIGSRTFPFVFGGDGASFVVSPDGREAAAEALAATVVFAREELGLALRAAMVPVADIRAAGQDLTVARFAPSVHVSYAMLGGGGAAWAEHEMKSGRYALAPAAPGARPDLTGLSCRWTPLESRRGVILSLIARPRADGEPGAFTWIVRSLLSLLAEKEDDEGRPVPPEGPRYRFPKAGLALEVRAAGGWRKLRTAAAIIAEMAFARLLFATGWRAGRFDPGHYRCVVAINSDFRKFDDGLKMTLDCSRDTADRVERVLAGAAERGILTYGLHRQRAAQMTCIVPSPLTDDHLHFVDGAGGGYAAAAEAMKIGQGARGPGRGGGQPVFGD
jgi:hypothetical protein